MSRLQSNLISSRLTDTAQNSTVHRKHRGAHITVTGGVPAPAPHSHPNYYLSLVHLRPGLHPSPLHRHLRRRALRRLGQIGVYHMILDSSCCRC
jgi:hypothetical protein